MNDLRHWPLITAAATLLVAGIAITPRLVGGSWAAAGSAPATCPAAFGMRDTRDTPERDGAGTRMVPDQPTGATICRYRLDAQFPSTPRPRPDPVPVTPTRQPRPAPLTRAQLKTIGCAPDRRPAPPVRPDPAVRAATDAAWSRIESWLKVHAPVSYASLRPPASPSDIQSAEAAMGQTFPDDVVSSLLRHDGVGSARYPFGVPYMFSPLPATRMVGTWKMLCGIVRTMADLSGTWWHGRLTPIGEDGTGVTLVADPAAHGKVGQADDESGLEFDADTSWPSYLALLKATAHGLETGAAVRGWIPEVQSGGLDWKPAHPPTMIPTKRP